MYYLIGKNLIHSYSQEIHSLLGNKEYSLLSLNEEEFHDFMMKKKYTGINITIPYKEIALKYVDVLDDISKKTGVVNTLINENGIIKGYNTDYYGFLKMCKNHNIDFKDKVALILGTGATSKTVRLCLENQGIKKIYFVSRNKKDNCLTYKEAEDLDDIDYIINTTPYGMYPSFQEDSLIDISKFSNLSACIDVIYNPFRTPLLIEARRYNIKAISGLEMLIEQARYANQLFFLHVDNQNIYKNVFLDKVNIVLIGMPNSGKTTIGKALSELLNKEFIDTDLEIEKVIHCSINECFQTHGEVYFRQVEEKIIEKVSSYQGKIISLGGGSFTNEKNIKNIMRNSLIVYLNRSLEFLETNPQNIIRPLLKNKDSMKQLYLNRHDIFLSCMDIEVACNNDIYDTVNEVIKQLDKYFEYKQDQ